MFLKMKMKMMDLDDCGMLLLEKLPLYVAIMIDDEP